MPKRSSKATEVVKITFLAERQNKEALDKLAASMQCNRSDILNEAVSAYLHVHQCQITDLKAALKEADGGTFATDQEVTKVFNQYIKN